MNRFECPGFDFRNCMLSRLMESLGILERQPRRPRVTPQRKDGKESAKSDMEVQTEVIVRGV